MKENVPMPVRCTSTEGRQRKREERDLFIRLAQGEREAPLSMPKGASKGEAFGKCVTGAGSQQ